MSPEKQEEMKLMNKLASSGGLPAKGPSSFLQKRLQHRVCRIALFYYHSSFLQKFFDSGDYAMDKAKKGGTATIPARGGNATVPSSTAAVDNRSLSVVVAGE